RAGGPRTRSPGSPTRGTSSAERPQPLLRRGVRGRGPAGRGAGRRRRPAPRRARGGRRVIRIRRAEPGDAAALCRLAEQVGREPGAWLLTTEMWRGVAEERRYLRAVRRHPDAAVFVVEADGEVVARLSLARDPH